MQPMTRYCTALLWLGLLMPLISAHATEARQVTEQGDPRPGTLPLSDLVLESVHVYGQGSPLTQPGLAAARDRLAERPGGTAVVDGDSYRDRRASTLTDALGYTAGVFVQPRFGSSEARLSIRGSGLQRTYHTRGIKLLQDGVPVSLADGSGDFEALELLSTRYIEVYRGANALEYGAANMGGAINFVSPTGYDADPQTIRVETGQFGYRRAQLAAGQVAGSLDGYASLSSFMQDGYRDHAEQENYRLFTNVGIRFSDTLDGRLYLTHVRNRSALPGNLHWAEFRQDPRQAAPGHLAGDQRRDFRLTRLAGKLGWQPAPGHELTAAIHLSDKSLDHPIYQVLMHETLDTGIDLRYRLDQFVAGHRNVLTMGLAAGRGTTDDKRYENRGGHRGTKRSDADQVASNLEGFIDNRFYITDQLAASAGLQFSRARRKSTDRLRTVDDLSYRINYTGTSPKVGLIYEPVEFLRLFTNLSRSHEPPSFGELAGGSQISLVDAQRATTLEAGARLQRDDLTIDLALYHARVKNELLSLNDANGYPLGTVNANRTIHQGLELATAWQAHSRLLITGNVLWNDFRFDDDHLYGNNRLAGVPPQQWRLEIKWSVLGEQLYLAPNLEWTPQAPYVDHANRLSADRYAILGLRIGGQIGSEWSWFIDGRNLTGRRYIATTDVVADSEGRDGAYFLPGDGRALYAGFEWRPTLR